MPRPACLKCQRFYRVKKQGVAVIEGMPNGLIHPAPPGTEHPEAWKPYKLWFADLFECEGCGHQLIAGWGLQNHSEHYMPDFGEQVERFKPITTINDC